MRYFPKWNYCFNVRNLLTRVNEQKFRNAKQNHTFKYKIAFLLLCEILWNKQKKIKLLKVSQHKIKTSDYMKHDYKNQNIKPSKTHYMYDTMLNKQLLINRNKNINDVL